MTTTAVAHRKFGAGLVDHPHEHVSEGHPYGHAPDQAHQHRDVEPIDVEPITAVVGSRLHDVTVLSILATGQFLWIAALGYGLLQLLR